MATKVGGKQKEHKHIKEAPKTCGYADWTVVKPQEAPIRAPRIQTEEKRTTQHCIPVHLKLSSALMQMLVLPKDRTPRHQQCSEVCQDFIETKQLPNCTTQESRLLGTRPTSASAWMEKGHSFEEAMYRSWPENLHQTGMTISKQRRRPTAPHTVQS